MDDYMSFELRRKRMTVCKMERSHSMWNVTHSNSNFSHTTKRSVSLLNRSLTSLNDIPRNSSAYYAAILRKRSKKKNLSTGRFSCPPCLQGDVHAIDSKGRSLLFYAARYGQVDTALQLLESGCDPNQRDSVGNTPLYEAIEKQNLEVAEVLLKHAATDVNIAGCNGETPLMLAVLRGHLDAVRLLHAYGSDLNSFDAAGNSPIYKALLGGWTDVAEFLLNNQCDVSKSVANEMTCFFAAAHCNKIQLEIIVKCLLKSGYDFEKDAEWLATEGCPLSLQNNLKLRNKILKRAGLRQSSTKSSFLSSGKRKLMKVLQSISK